MNSTPASPLLLSTWSFATRAHTRVWPGLARGGAALDAVEAVCRDIEEDPTVDSVGYGGLPDAEGRVSLDASIMLSPREAGGVCALSHYLPAITVARAVMERTRHTLLAGPGAEELAAELGLEARDLLSPKARERWEERRRRHSETGRASEGGHDYGWPDEPEGHDTVGALARDVRGTLAGACSTSGLAFKRHGRVGDSPIIGHGLYVEPGIGAAVATGLGELAMGVCATFLAVESLRRGDSPSDAAAVPLRRIADQFELHPQHQLAVLVLVPDGSWSAAALRPGYVTSVRSEDEEGTREPDTVLFP